ncbi:Oligopeptide transporter, OPT superfamily [Sesbania bispinosa]|nr:Oligopeptide transporter, OPT superfamily [Sesbania bispinosa]
MEEENLKGEAAFKRTNVPTWTEQITVRSVVTSFVLSLMFGFIVCKLNFTTGIIPSLNVAAGLLGFAVIKSYTVLLDKCGLLKQPFTRQENTVIQTCIVASSGIAFSSGTGSYLLGMSPYIASQVSGGNTPINTKSLSLGWMFGFLFAVSFVGLFSIVPLRKLMILKYKLTYPSGTATALLINSLHTPKGAKLANFPTFGLQAYKKRFYFDFSPTYVGVGMICPYMVNASLLLGAIISWGILWPWVEHKKGIWYRADLPASSLYSIQGFRIFTAIAMILGDGLYHCIYMMFQVFYNLISQYLNREGSSSINPEDIDQTSDMDYDNQLRKEYFLKDQIPIWVACTGYVVLAIVSIITVSHIFPQLKWYHIMVAYIIAPVLAFCNAYGCGLTDWSLASNYGKVAILIFSSWVGIDNGGIIAGLASCGVMMSIVSTASDLMQDFKTGYLTLASPRSMFLSQVLGTIMGCVLSPLTFWFYYKAYTIGDPKGSYPAPYGQIFRGISLLGANGVSSLPKHCLVLAIICFCSAVFINIIRDLLMHFETKYKIYRFVPSPMCMAIPFYVGGYFAVDMCIGSLILYVWEKKNKQKAKDYAPALASGLICGDSLWSVPAAILSLAGVKSPICMKFLSSAVNQEVDNILNGVN